LHIMLVLDEAEERCMLSMNEQFLAIHCQNFHMHVHNPWHKEVDINRYTMLL
jgi:hypothetical protein